MTKKATPFEVRGAIIYCPRCEKEVDATYSDHYVSDVSYGCSCCGGSEYEVEVYLNCGECGETHTWTL